MKKTILCGLMVTLILSILSFGVLAQSDKANYSGMFLVVATIVDQNGKIIGQPSVGATKNEVVVLSDKKVKEGKAFFHDLVVKITDVNGIVHTHQGILEKMTGSISLRAKNIIAPNSINIQARFMDDNVGRIIVAYSNKGDLVVRSFSSEEKTVSFFASLKPKIEPIVGFASDASSKTPKITATYDGPDKLRISIKGESPDTLVINETIYLPVKTKSAEQTVVEKKGEEKPGVDNFNKSKQEQISKISTQSEQNKDAHVILKKEAAQKCTEQKDTAKIDTRFHFRSGIDQLAEEYIQKAKNATITDEAFDNMLNDLGRDLPNEVITALKQYSAANIGASSAEGIISTSLALNGLKNRKDDTQKLFVVATDLAYKQKMIVLLHHLSNIWPVIIKKLVDEGKTREVVNFTGYGFSEKDLDPKYGYYNARDGSCVFCRLDENMAKLKIVDDKKIIYSIQLSLATDACSNVINSIKSNAHPSQSEWEMCGKTLQSILKFCSINANELPESIKDMIP